jgi:hypothetical protein
VVSEKQGQGQNLGKLFWKKVFQTFQKLYLKPRRGFRKTRSRSKPWKTFLEKSFPNLSKNFT